MPWYNDLRPDHDPKRQNYSVTFRDFPDQEKERAIEKLLALRAKLSDISELKKTNKNLLLASWNIKHFGESEKRLPESFFYIAEIISSFDLVAIQEIRADMRGLNIIMKLLGKYWKYLITDVTEGRAGNDERFAYLYDTRRVNFTGLAGEIVLWKELQEMETQVEIQQLKRTPSIMGFQAGWKSFSLVNLHLQPNNSTEGKRIRKKEVDLLMRAIQKKLRLDNLWNDNLILLGDFNLYHTDTDIVQLFNDHGFFESDIVEGTTTNTAKNAKYAFDRFFFRKNRFFEVPAEMDGNEGGAFDFFDVVFKETDYSIYKDRMITHKPDLRGSTETRFHKYFRDHWRKNQLSDHLPLWIEITIDSSDEFLSYKLRQHQRS